MKSSTQELRAELEHILREIETASVHCNHLLNAQQKLQDWEMERDAEHLRARISGLAAQAADVMRTMDRLVGRERRRMLHAPKGLAASTSVRAFGAAAA